MKMTNENGKVNVAAMARKICGITSGKPVGKMTLKEKHDFWNVSKVFAKNSPFIHGQKQRGGYGMKIIEKFVYSK